LFLEVLESPDYTETLFLKFLGFQCITVTIKTKSMGFAVVSSELLRVAEMEERIRVMLEYVDGKFNSIE